MALLFASVTENLPCRTRWACKPARRVTWRHSSPQCVYGALAMKSVPHTRQTQANHRFRRGGTRVSGAVVARGSTWASPTALALDHASWSRLEQDSVQNLDTVLVVMKEWPQNPHVFVCFLRPLILRCHTE